MMGNVMQTQEATRKPQFPYAFQFVNVTGTDGTLNVAADTNVAVTQRVMKDAGCVTGLAVSLSGTLTSGTLTVYPTINGATLTDLAVELGLPGDQYDYDAVDGRVYNYAAGDRLGVVFVNASVSPDNSRDMLVDVYTMVENLEL